MKQKPALTNISIVTTDLHRLFKKTTTAILLQSLFLVLTTFIHADAFKAPIFSNTQCRETVPGDTYWPERFWAHQLAPQIGFWGVSGNSPTVISSLTANHNDGYRAVVQMQSSAAPIDGTAPGESQGDGKNALRNLLTIVDHGTKPLNLVMTDFEPEYFTGGQTMANANSAETRRLLLAKPATIYTLYGNYGAAPVDWAGGSAKWWMAPWYQAQGGSASQVYQADEVYRTVNAGGSSTKAFNVVAPVCYLSAYSKELAGATNFASDGIPPGYTFNGDTKFRSLLFLTALGRFSDASYNRRGGDYAIPYVGGWVNPENYEIKPPHSSDRTALTSHLRMRGAYGFVHYSETPDSNKPNGENSKPHIVAQWLAQGWYCGLDSRGYAETTMKLENFIVQNGAPGTPVFLAVNGIAKNRRDGIFWSGLKMSNGAMVTVISNLSNVTRTVKYSDDVGNLTTSGPKIQNTSVTVAPFTHVYTYYP